MSERRSLPSASGMERLYLCPGSFVLEAQCPEVPSSAEAESGTRIHAALAGKLGPERLTEAELEKFRECEQMLAATCRSTLGCEIHECDRVFRDVERLWLHDPLTLEPIMSGLPDVLAFRGDAVLIADFKTGWEDVEPGRSNWQLRALVALVGEHWPKVKRVYAAVIQPWHSWRQATAVYDRSDIDQAVTDIAAVAKAATVPGQKLVPGPAQCRYCRAKTICPEAQGTVLAVEKAKSLAVSNERLSELLSAAKVAEKVIDEIRREARQRLKLEADCIPGWTLRKGHPKRPITDNETVFRRVLALGIAAEDLVSNCVEIAKGKLEDLVKATTGKKGKELEAAMEELLLNCTEERPSEPSLVPVKKD